MMQTEIFKLSRRHLSGGLDLHRSEMITLSNRSWQRSRLHCPDPRSSKHIVPVPLIVTRTQPLDIRDGRSQGNKKPDPKFIIPKEYIILTIGQEIYQYYDISSVDIFNPHKHAKVKEFLSKIYGVIRQCLWVINEIIDLVNTFNYIN